MTVTTETRSSWSRVLGISGPLWPLPVFDVVLASVFAVVAAVSLYSDAAVSGLVIQGEVGRSADLAALLVVLAQSLPLALRRSSAGPAFLVIAAAGVLNTVLQVQPNPADFTLPFAIYAFSAYAAYPVAVRAALPVLALVAWGSAFGIVAVAEEAARDAPWSLVTEPLVAYVTLCGAWQVLGEARRRLGAEARAMRRRAVDAEVRRREVESRAVAQRRQLGRDLHDAIGHQVTLVVLQADALRVDEPDPQRREGLEVLGRAGRVALAELRELVAVLDLGGAAERTPLPSLAELDALVAPVRGLGLVVEVHEHGTPRPLAASIELSACRVVQEALTNVLRHASATKVRVSVAHGSRAVVVEVRDDGRGPSAARDPGAGSGLRGLQERLRLIGGDLSVGAAQPHGFVVTAWLPTHMAAP